jgi:hypothetical protein
MVTLALLLVDQKLLAVVSQFTFLFNGGINLLFKHAASQNLKRLFHLPSDEFSEAF